MLNDVDALAITVYPPARQGRGAFDGGRITEFKPIGFPGDGAEVKRVGPLFYWAWASAHTPSKIGLHPHKAFEIMSYVLEGEIATIPERNVACRIEWELEDLFTPWNGAGPCEPFARVRVHDVERVASGDENVLETIQIHIDEHGPPGPFRRLHAGERRKLRKRPVAPIGEE